jgi:hypothetical protein
MSKTSMKPKINDCFEPVFEPVFETDQRQKCKPYDECKYISNETSSSTSYKWKHFRDKHPKHPILEHDSQKLKRKAEDDPNATTSKQPKMSYFKLNFNTFLVLD